MSDLTCPDCRGEKTLMAFVDGHRPDGTSFGGLQRVNCLTCSGTGEVDKEHADRLAAGKAMRAARLANDQSLRDAAKERGISPAHLSAIENGRTLPTDTEATP